jgi:hypothetical protein
MSVPDVEQRSPRLQAVALSKAGDRFQAVLDREVLK